MVDSAGLKGTYDFDLKCTSRSQLAAAGGGGISIFDAAEKHLGLKLELKQATVLVVAVKSVDQTPTANAPEIASILPSLAAPKEFQTATVKLTPPEVKQPRFEIQPNGQIDIQNSDLSSVIKYFWQLNDGMIVGAPKWLGDTKIDMIAQAPSTALINGPAGPTIDGDKLMALAKNLLVQRFKIRSHMEERLGSTYSLFASAPKMKPGDTNGRIRCSEDPSTIQKRPLPERLITCQNMTMARFAGMLHGFAPGYIQTPVLDATKLGGSWNFTFRFSEVSDLKGVGSFPNALEGQLGLKLGQTRRPVKVLVLDHIEPKPTEN